MTERQPMMLWLRLHELFESPEGDGGRHEALHALVREETAKLREENDGLIRDIRAKRKALKEFGHKRQELRGWWEDAEEKAKRQERLVSEKAEEVRKLREENERLRETYEGMMQRITQAEAVAIQRGDALATARAALVFSQAVHARSADKAHHEECTHSGCGDVRLAKRAYWKLEAALAEIDKDGGSTQSPAQDWAEETLERLRSTYGPDAPFEYPEPKENN